MSSQGGEHALARRLPGHEAGAMDQSQNDYYNNNPAVRRILDKFSGKIELSKEKQNKFVAGKVVDILLPFPDDAMGLPTGLSSLERDLFVAYQKGEMQDVELVGLFREMTDTTDTPPPPPHLSLAEDPMAGELVEEPRGRGGFATVLAVRHKSNRDEHPTWYALKRLDRPDQDWSPIGRIGEVGDGHYPDPSQTLFETEVNILKRLRIQERDPAYSKTGWKEIFECHFVDLRATFTSPRAFHLLLSPVAICNFEELLAYYTKEEDPELRPPEHTLERLKMHEESGLIDLARVLSESFGCLAAALLYMHHIAHIRHRDIKPKNVLLVHDEGKGMTMCCICDFASAYDTMDQRSTGVSRFNTRYYPSPERLERSTSINTKDDMYTLGLVFFEIFAALKRQSHTELRGLGREREEGPAVPQGTIPFLDRHWTEDELAGWGRDRLDEQPEAINPAFDWIRNLLRRDPRLRSSSRELSAAIRQCGAIHHRFWGHCCNDFYGKAGLDNLFELKRDEKIAIKATVSKAICQWQPGAAIWKGETPTGEARIDKIDKASTAVIVETAENRPTERRLLVVQNSEWPYPSTAHGSSRGKPDEARKFSRGIWLPATGLIIKTSMGNKLAIEWSHYNHEIRAPTGITGCSYWLGFNSCSRNMRLELVFVDESGLDDFVLKLRGIFEESEDQATSHFKISETDEFYVRDVDHNTFPPTEGIQHTKNGALPLESRIQPGKVLLRIQKRRENEHIHDLYLVQARCSPRIQNVDVRMAAGRLRLTVSGLWSLGYRSTEKKPGRPPEETEMEEPLELVYTARSSESHRDPPTEPPLTLDPSLPLSCLEDIGNQQLVIMDRTDLDVQLQSLIGLLKSLTGWRMHFICVGHCSRPFLKTFKTGRTGQGLMMLWEKDNEWRLTFLPEVEGEKALLGKVRYGAHVIEECNRDKRTCTIRLHLPVDEGFAEKWKTNTQAFKFEMRIIDEDVWEELSKMAAPPVGGNVD